MLARLRGLILCAGRRWLRGAPFPLATLEGERPDEMLISRWASGRGFRPMAIAALYDTGAVVTTWADENSATVEVREGRVIWPEAYHLGEWRGAEFTSSMNVLLNEQARTARVLEANGRWLIIVAADRVSVSVQGRGTAPESPRLQLVLDPQLFASLE